MTGFNILIYVVTYYFEAIPKWCISEWRNTGRYCCRWTSVVEVGRTPVSGELSVEAGRKPLVSGLSGVEASGMPFSGEYGREVGDCAVSEDSGIEAGGN